jgi:hypothetical protein
MKQKNTKKPNFEFTTFTSDYGFLEIEVADSIEISVRSKNSLYVKIGDITYYIDNSTNEQILHKF